MLRVEYNTRLPFTDLFMSLLGASLAVTLGRIACVAATMLIAARVRVLREYDQ